MQTRFTKKDFSITHRETIYQGYFSLVRYHLKHRLFNGELSHEIVRDTAERYPAVAVLPYDPLLDRVILIEQFRIGALNDPISPWQIEIPAGLIDSAETPEQVAHRETKEEAGCTLTNLTLLYDFFVSPGAGNEYLHIYYGEVNSAGVEGVHGLQDEHEDIRVLNLSREEAFAQLDNRNIKSMPAIVALQWLKLNYPQLKRLPKKLNAMR